MPSASSCRFPICILLTAAMVVAWPLSLPLWSDQTSESSDSASAGESDTDPNATDEDSTAAAAAAAQSDQAKSGSTSAGDEKKPAGKYPAYTKVLKNAKRIDGLVTLHRKEGKLFAELRPNQLNREFIVLITIARGIGQTPILGGFSWGFGDDWVWQFRRAGERIHLVRRNVRFTAKKGSPSERAVRLAYTDSVLFSLPIATKSSAGNYVVDLTPVFMSDLPQISMVLTGYTFSAQKSTWADVKSFDKNLELQVAATYASRGKDEIDSVPDSRGVTVNVHYSISELPQTDYRPRLADDRIGYFLTALKDFSKREADDRFERYINRWHLEKADRKADVSPPKEPIVFWLEKTIPYKYRKPIRDGIAEWNKAFEKAGFYDAIDVRQQPDDATWEPGDIRYNTFRWITSGAGFAMGPSRVNPRTGQILDADIIFDADFLQYWKQTYETYTPEGLEVFTGGPFNLADHRARQRQLPPYLRHDHGARCLCNLLGGMSQQFAYGAAVLATRQQSGAELDKLILQGIKETTMHEVGHTLGLRHNFKASTLYSLEELNDVTKTGTTGLSASVMDYHPVNVAPNGTTQGDFFSTTIGPYDYWAIEYGYKPIKASSTAGERKALQKIAARSGEHGLAFATDQDARGIDPDPHAVRFDFSNDLVAFAEQRAKLVAETWPEIVERMTGDGESYERARRAFGTLLYIHGGVMTSVSRYVGGIYISRSHKGDTDAQPPLVVVPVDKQRQALDLLEKQVFSDQPFSFPPELYNHLAASNWSHWGVDVLDRKDYPAHQIILSWQDRILGRLLSPLTLSRIHDSELKVPADEDALTVAELIERLTTAIFTETTSLEDGEFTLRKPAISSLRRNLQRAYLKRLSRLAIGDTTAPEDCQTIAFAELARLKTRADQVLAADVRLDSYSRAHLQETSARITKVLDATMIISP